MQKGWVGVVHGQNQTQADSRHSLSAVTPAKAGVQNNAPSPSNAPLDCGFRRNDGGFIRLACQNGSDKKNTNCPPDGSCGKKMACKPHLAGSLAFTTSLGNDPLAPLPNTHLRMGRCWCFLLLLRRSQTASEKKNMRHAAKSGLCPRLPPSLLRSRNASLPASWCWGAPVARAKAGWLLPCAAGMPTRGTKWRLSRRRT